MKFFCVFIWGCILIMGCNPVDRANRIANKNKVNVIYPSGPFDSLQAKSALAIGKSIIQGVAFTKPKTNLGYKAPLAKRIYGANIRVVLYPVTPYFEEWYNLRNKKEGKKTRVYLSDAAARYGLATNTDEYGRFTFKQMKPGKYFIQAILDWHHTTSANVYQGSGYDGYGRTDYYTRQYYNVEHSDRLEKFITIENEGETVKVSLK
ncbi:hypothetical protein [Xanthocytophaga flava]|uniref:hypothetical protein n=1 Tax=Xanthocytophaga flava TaxID=3048013 RepID=UPI0028D28E96|nr:hypothetical protein [Xanthocytophaga flavus]MDJ1472784.1 hypothetical protein [Xanthocytophaga flavus]